jgi:hypothetical protein
MSSRPPVPRRPLPASAQQAAQQAAATSHGRSFAEVSDYREMPTLIADPAVFHGMPDERTPVTELKTPVMPRKPRLSVPYMVIAAVLVMGIGLVAYRGMSRAGSINNAPVASRVATGEAAAAAPGAEAGKVSADAKTAPAANAPAPSDEPGFIQATPAAAARSFALGEYDRALEMYRFLAHQNPDAEVYAVMVKVLTSKTKER